MEKPNWLDHPALKDMHPAKREIIIDIIKESAGKPLNQSLPIILKAQNRLKSEGLSFTTEESALLMTLLTQGLSPAEMAKVEAMKKMMKH